MSKAPSSELFDLIKSLNKSKKRYFKVFASRHIIGEENKYVKLFDMIDRQSIYNEKKILKKADITKQQLDNWKRYLYELILRSMDIYTADDNAEKTIKKLLRHAEILSQTGLYAQCINLLAKAKQLAAKYEYFLLVYEILSLEETTFRKMYDVKNFSNYIGNNAKERELTLAKIITINKYRDLYLQTNLLMNKEGVSRSNTDAKQFDIIAGHPLMKDEKLATSYEAKILYYNIQFLHAYNIEKIKSTYPINKKRVAYIEQHPHQIAETPSHYMDTLNHLAMNCYELGKHEECMNILKKMRTLPLKTLHLQHKAFSYISHLELTLYIEKGQYQKAIALIDEIKKGFDRFGDKFDKYLKLIFHYNTSVLYFITKDYHTALKWLNIILNDPEKNLRKDIHCFAQILNLIIHYELGNQGFLEYAVKSSRHFLDKRNRLFVFETSMINFFRKKLPNVHTAAQRTEVFKELKKEIMEITKNNFEKKALDYFDIISWVESKIEHRSFAEIVRQKAKFAAKYESHLFSEA